MRYVASAIFSVTPRSKSATTTIASASRMNAMTTSSIPHHRGKDSGFLDNPAATGKIEEITNTIAVATANRRPARADVI